MEKKTGIVKVEIGSINEQGDFVPENEIKNITGIYLVPKDEWGFPCEHNNYRAGHSPFVACICNDCGSEI